MDTTKQDPETGKTLYLRRRKDGSMADSAWVWESADGLVVVDATPEEDAAAVEYYDPSHTL